jgi:ubiquinone/menaquinone biosynthesis C-methylase UbiE
MFNLMLHERLFMAPIASPKNVLDIGTGTGTWYGPLAI